MSNPFFIGPLGLLRLRRRPRMDQQHDPAPARQARRSSGLHQRRQQLQQHLRLVPVSQERRPALHGGHGGQLRDGICGGVRGDGDACRAGEAEPQAGEGGVGGGRGEWGGEWVPI